LPSRKRKSSRTREPEEREERESAAVRSLWSGTITFGLVSIPVDLLTAVRPRQTAMKLVDSGGHALGREYHCSKEDKRLDYDDLVRGYETDEGKMVVITDQEFESVAPEMSADIELRSFVPLEQIPALYFQKPYFLAPSGKSAKAYVLLAQTMEHTGRVAIGSFVMRGHEYLVAIVPDNGVLRADTLRYADEIRTPESLELPKRGKVAAAKVSAFSKAIENLTHKELNIAELEDREAQQLQSLVQAKQKDRDAVVHPKGAEAAEETEAGEGAKIIDLMEVLRNSLSKSAVVKRAGGGGEPINLAERRAQRAAKSATPKKKTSTKAKRKTPRKRARRS
jgi:DNA end-binding protein Ku